MTAKRWSEAPPWDRARRWAHSAGTAGRAGPRGIRPEIFVLGSGQDDNLGDVVLRREYFDRLRRLGRLHLYLGVASTEFVESLRLSPSDLVYTRLRDWHRAAWRALLRGPVWYVGKPGELSLDRLMVNLELRLLPLVIAVRCRGGQVLRLGMALRTLDRRGVRWLRPLFQLSTVLRWRDTSSGAAFGFGRVAPDWAFGWEETDLDSLSDRRGDIAVSYRGDCPLLPEPALSALRSVARHDARRLVVVTQVRRDAARSAELAASLGAELVSWPAERSLAEHEKILRTVYRDSALVVSDRLHALILGMTEGAVPLCLGQAGQRKIGRHLEAVGFHRSTVGVDDVASSALPDIIERQVERRDEALHATRVALSTLDELTEHLAELARA